MIRIQNLSERIERWAIRHLSNRRRFLFVANERIPTLQINFLVPLEADEDVWCDVLREPDLRPDFQSSIEAAPSGTEVEAAIRHLRQTAPEVVVFCRYSGPGARALVQAARQLAIPVVFHLDDDLLNVPRELGEKKFKFHNNPERTGTIRYLLAESDVVYFANARVAELFAGQKFRGKTYSGEVAAGYRVLQGPPREFARLGYMGFDHAHDFAQIAPAIIRFLDHYPEMEFEVFGPIAIGDAFQRFGSRVHLLPTVPDYRDFLDALAQRQWAVGIAPLALTEFNRRKSINKWIEYSAVGACTLATANTIYDHCGADECARLLPNEAQSWFDALVELKESPHRRHEIVANAQARLQREYPLDRLRRQFSEVLQRAGRPGLR